jgi:hypothetical protein
MAGRTDTGSDMPMSTYNPFADLKARLDAKDKP